MASDHGLSRDLFLHDEILDGPGLDDPDLEVLHDREYRVRSYRSGDTLLLLGAVRDQKPPGLLVPGDPDPITIHHMQLRIELALPSLEITDVRVVFETHPRDTCPAIAVSYEALIGTSIARGFNRRVRELFGGPRGCSHTTALLQAMGPVAMQSSWSMRASDHNRAVAAAEARGEPAPELDVTAARAADEWFMRDSCHIWTDGGEMAEASDTGAEPPMPIFLRRRYEELGLDPLRPE